MKGDSRSRGEGRARIVVGSTKSGGRKWGKSYAFNGLLFKKPP